MMGEKEVDEGGQNLCPWTVTAHIASQSARKPRTRVMAHVGMPSVGTRWGRNVRVSQQVEKRRTQGGEPSQNEMDVRRAISAGLELGGPPRMSSGAKERRAG
ncbi:hypothetical protein ALC53_02776 [Atta colombica]|uniref:Uncharacterized protein n=1 Tax=Atta colombica TaxID=520822 RepID=A0A195BQQ5_9HYME|nr:hypothetical protein ALC53_02776 [Atta colombica]